MKLKKVVKPLSTPKGPPDDYVEKVVSKARKKKKRRTTKRRKSMGSSKSKKVKLGMLQGAQLIMSASRDKRADIEDIISNMPGRAGSALSGVAGQASSGLAAGLGGLLGGVPDPGANYSEGPPEFSEAIDVGVPEPGADAGPQPTQQTDQIPVPDIQLENVDPTWMQSLIDKYRQGLPTWAQYAIPAAGLAGIGGLGGYMLARGDEEEEEEEEEKYAALKQSFDTSSALTKSTGDKALGEVRSYMSPSATAGTSTAPTAGVSPVTPVKMAGLTDYCVGFLKTCIGSGLDQQQTVATIIKAAEVDPQAAKEWMGFVKANL